MACSLIISLRKGRTYGYGNREAKFCKSFVIENMDEWGPLVINTQYALSTKE